MPAALPPQPPRPARRTAGRRFLQRCTLTLIPASADCAAAVCNGSAAHPLMSEAGLWWLQDAAEAAVGRFSEALTETYQASMAAKLGLRAYDKSTAVRSGILCWSHCGCM